MNSVIKCPICHEMAELRYNENRVYQCRCQNMECRETVTVTAPNGKAAEELFSKFEKGTSQPKLSIPKKIAELLDVAIEGLTKFEDFLWAVDEFDVLIPNGKVEYFRNWTNEEPNAHALAVSYVTGKALGVELAEVSVE